MNTTTALREALTWSFDLLELVIQDVTSEQAHWPPPGSANPIGATYAHAICGADGVVHMLLKNSPPLYESTWSGRTGISHPQMGAEFEWARKLTVDLHQARVYARAVHESIDAYISDLDETALEREVDLTAQGLGVRTLNWCLNALVIAHSHNMAGEISVLKGLQGGQGYPF